LRVHVIIVLLIFIHHFNAIPIVLTSSERSTLITPVNSISKENLKRAHKRNNQRAIREISCNPIYRISNRPVHSCALCVSHTHFVSTRVLQPLLHGFCIWRFSSHMQRTVFLSAFICIDSTNGV
jgi:hypothetical protein